MHDIQAILDFGTEDQEPVRWIAMSSISERPGVPGAVVIRKSGGTAIVAITRIRVQQEQ